MGLELKAAQNKKVMVAPITLDNVKFDVLFDTGASVSVVGKECLMKIIRNSKDIDLTETQQFETLGGGVNSLGTVSLNVLVISRTVNHKFHVIDGHKIILGMDIMEKLGVKLDIRRKIIKLGNGKNGKIMNLYESKKDDKIEIRCKEDVELKSRSATCIQVVVVNKNVTTLLFEPLIKLNEFCPRSLLTVRDGVSFICLLNSTDGNHVFKKEELLGFGSSKFEYVDQLKDDSGDKHFIDKEYRDTINNVDNNNGNYKSNSNINNDHLTRNKIKEKINKNEYLNKEQKSQLEQLLLEHSDIFNDKLEKGGLVDQFPCNLKPMANTLPVYSRQYNYSEKELQNMDKEVEDLIENEVIENSVSPWESPVVMIKKTDGNFRFCIDFRKLNKVMEKDAYPLPNIELVLRKFDGCNYFSKIDFTSGFFQIKIDENDRKYTAFSTRRGKFQFKVLPQGFINSSSIFQRTMNLILSGLSWEYLLVYVDDILVFSKTFDDHLAHLRNLFTKLREYKLTVKISKCEFGNKELLFLGHIISGKGIKTDPRKCAVIAKSGVPLNLGEVRTFLGATGYYRKFIQRYSDLAKPLRELANGNKWYWGKDEQVSWLNLKEKLCNAPILAHPDNTKPFKLLCDASAYAIGVVLEQDGHPIYYYSQSLKKSERRYGTSERECLAMVLGIKKFRNYLYGNPFTVVTDHSCLRYLFENRDHVGRLMRWSLILQEYCADMNIVYKPGKLHNAPDACSRMPFARSNKLEEWFNIYDVSDEINFIDDDSDDEIVINTLRGNRSDFMDTERDEEYNQRIIEDLKTGEDDNAKEKDIVTKLLGEKKNTNNKRDCDEESVDESWDEKKFMELSDFGKIQKEDLKAGPVIDYFLYGKLPVVDADHVYKTFKECIMENGQIYKVEYKNGVMRQCLWIPESKAKDIIEEFHGSYLGGHCGFERTLSKISERYYFPYMYSKIKNYVQCCIECQRKKGINRKEYNIMTPLQHPSYPFERMSMDLVGPLTETKNGNKYVLTVMDYFTRWPEAIPIKNAKAETVAQHYLDLVITRYGCPRIILTDLGSQFTSDLFDYVNKVLKTQHRTTTPYHPQTNGVIEKFHYSLVNSIKYVCSTRENDWDEFINMSLFVFRTTKNKTLEMTPFEAMHGFKASLP